MTNVVNRINKSSTPYLYRGEELSRIKQEVEERIRQNQANGRASRTAKDGIQKMPQGVPYAINASKKVMKEGPLSLSFFW